MAYPTHDTQHAAEAKAFLTDHYRNKLVIGQILDSIMPVFQEIEDVFWDIINKFQLANSPTGDQLNLLGKIVGAQRGSMNDADYLAAVLLQIRVNRSQGTANDIIDCATIALRGNGTKPNYVEPIPAAGTQNAVFLVEARNLASPQTLENALPHARSLGVYGELHYSNWAPGNDFKLTSRYGGATGEGKWGSRYTGSVGSNLLASTAV